MTETGTRHSVLTKQKHFRFRDKGALQSNSNKLTGETNEAPIEVEDGPVLAREESDEQIDLNNIPSADEADEESLFVQEDGPRRSKRSRRTTNDAESGMGSSPEIEPDPKRRRDVGSAEGDDDDDKKKMAVETTYDGFGIYGRVLCLVVKRKDNREISREPRSMGGQARMEDWITATQMPILEDD